ncbi:putative F-box/LRR-repeat protein 23 [Ricinus communis]|uniref:Ubiquitin-protein ligase, putative n=1 Tax=Ricinus communis TaxID=3988 RepID=B9SKT5_RICCO|nr:putative F-box/LRR-repeat protein 23 [Ricinus communis]EEF35763.1 ubiquitin-protein ligase, putative [Ricinus communis]|eukprot:XP_002526604.1 putative F-box/LRR-repeat protein 23 [Ricinus communis]
MDSYLSPPPQLQEDSYRNWAELPRDVTALILDKVGAFDILGSAQFVCSSWNSVCKDPSMWRSVEIHPLCDFWDLPFDLEALCRNAVDRSRGGLISISIEYFATDSLIKYIADRSSHLKRLRLLSSYTLSDAAFSKAAKKFPLLEELDISYCSLSTEALVGVGISCPLLRSLKLNCQGYKRPHIESNEEALAIGQWMPHLRYLQIFGNKLTNDGVQAILDGCPHLEFLDLRQCFNVHLEGELGMLCGERIKDLRRPDDPTDDYPFNPEIPDYGSSEEDYPSGFSDMEFATDDDDDYYAFSDGIEDI